MQVYKVTLTLQLDDNASHPRKWLADAVSESLRSGEEITSIEYEQIQDEHNEDIFGIVPGSSCPGSYD